MLLIPPAVGLALGALGSLLLARRIKRQTFDLEPNEIATLLEQREAVLHGIREGTVATDTQGRVTLLNDEAKRLLDVDDPALGRRLGELVPAGHAREVLEGNVVGCGPDRPRRRPRAGRQPDAGRRSAGGPSAPSSPCATAPSSRSCCAS